MTLERAVGTHGSSVSLTLLRALSKKLSEG